MSNAPLLYIEAFHTQKSLIISLKILDIEAFHAQKSIINITKKFEIIFGHL